MKYYLAPMEGITGFVYRNSHKKFFTNFDKYFTPFIIPNKGKSLKSKELLDVIPENNKNINIVPQILTNDWNDFINTAEKLRSLGYEEINLNLGCPSGTVVGKGKGAGFLSKREELDDFLEEIFKINNMKISIKTRIGMYKQEEFYELIKIYNKYPMEELIIHPRTQRDFYGNTPNLEIFKVALEFSKNRICYNGDIFTTKDNNEIIKKFNNLDTIMLGRGVLANPGLLDEIKNVSVMDKYTLISFHNTLLNEYSEIFSEEKGILFKMKELWFYFGFMFSNGKEYVNKIRRTKTLKEYNQVVSILFNEEDLIKETGAFNK